MRIRRAAKLYGQHAQLRGHKAKTELVHHRDHQTRDEARHDIFEFIEIVYNRQRSHSALGYLSPAQFEVTALAA